MARPAKTVYRASPVAGFANTHIGAARRHAQHRFWQRYNRAISEPELAAFERMIVDGSAVRLTDRDSRGEVWLIRSGAIDALAVFRRDIGAIITFLPKEARRRFDLIPG